MNRQQKRELDREARKSIQTIRHHLDFLNAAGNPKYKLVKQSAFAYHAKNMLRKMRLMK